MSVSDQIKKLQQRIQQLESQLAEDKSTYAVGQPGPLQMGKMTDDRLKEIDASLRRLAAAGLTFAKGGALNRALEDTAATFDKMTGNAAMGAAGVEKLATGFAKFAELSELMDERKDGTRAFSTVTESMAKQAAALDRLGLGFQEYSKNLDLAVNMFNMTEKQVLSLNAGLVSFAKEMKMLPSIVSQNFQLVAKSLSYEAPKVAEQFKKMQSLSQQTGVSVGTLMSGMGERLDTISGAAQFTGQLNSILGGNFFSPNEILMMDEAERMVRIRSVIQGHPIYNEIVTGGKLGKFALNTLSKVVGFSKEDTRKYLMGKEMDDPKTLKERAAANIEKRQRTGRTMEGDVEAEEIGTRGLFTVTRNLSNDLKEYTQMIKNAFLSTRDRAFVEDRAKFAVTRDFDFSGDAGDELLSSLKGQAAFEFGSEAFSAAAPFKMGPGDIDQFNRARARFSQINEVFKLLQTIPEDRKERQIIEPMLRDLMQEAGGVSGLSPEQVSSVLKNLQELKLTSTKLIPRGKLDDLVSLEEQLILSRIPKTFGLFNEYLRKFRSKAYTPEELEEIPNEVKEDIEKNMEILRERGDLTPELQKELERVSSTVTGGKTGPSPKKDASKKSKSGDSSESEGDPSGPINKIIKGLIDAFSKMTLEVPIGEGQYDRIVGLTLKRNGINNNS